MHKTKPCRAVLVLIALLSGSALADSIARASRGSSQVSAGTGLALEGSLDAFVGTSELLVTGVATVGDVVSISLSDASRTSAVVVGVAADRLGSAILTAGTVVRLVAEESGYALYHAADLIAFIPNAVGHALLHHSRHVGAER